VKSLVAQPLRISSRIAPVRFTLENGLRVIVQPVRGNATVFIDGQVEGSPLLEPADKDGLREMTSDLLGYGGQKYDFTALHELSDRLGAALSFGESFSAHGLASDFPTLLDVLADGQLHPTFPSNFVALVRKQTLAQIDARDRDPDSLAARKLSLGLLPAGDPDLRQATRASVARIKNSDFAEYLRRAYRPDLTVISVVGDVDPQVVRDEIVRTFGAWHATGTKPSLFLAAVPLPKPVQSHVLASRRLVEVSLAQPAISRSAPDFVAFNLLNEMLGGGGTFDTRLMRELRERRGLVYSASSGLEVGKYRGVLAINLSTPPEHAAQAIALVKAALIEFTKHAPSQSELDRARERLVAGSLVGEQSTAVIAAHVAQIGFYNLPNDYYKNLWQRYNRITPADILNVARRRLQPNHLVVVTEGPGR
jgi:zinc protease